MKKVLFGTLLPLLLMVGFTSCESEDPEGRLSGSRYECVHEFGEMGDDWYVQLRYIYLFHSNGTATYQLDGYKSERILGVRYTDHDYMDSTIDKFIRYRVEGDRVVVYWESTGEVLDTGTIKANTIVMDCKDGEEQSIYVRLY